jgi:hypothetical protein
VPEDPAVVLGRSVVTAARAPRMAAMLAAVEFSTIDEGLSVPAGRCIQLDPALYLAESSL